MFIAQYNQEFGLQIVEGAVIFAVCVTFSNMVDHVFISHLVSYSTLCRAFQCQLSSGVGMM